MKRIAVVQSNYIPWKGYFDMIAAVDEFVLYDDVQFTKNDWRNRNRIKTPKGLEWLSIPVGDDIGRLIRDVELPDRRWRGKHWKTLEANYRRASCFEHTAAWLEPIYRAAEIGQLSEINRILIESVCKALGITTPIRYSWDYRATGERQERLMTLCEQAGADVYVSGPAAKAYLDERSFRERRIRLEWFDYSGYPVYPQLWGGFAHQVSILDLLFNCGAAAPQFMKFSGSNWGQSRASVVPSSQTL